MTKKFSIDKYFFPFATLCLLYQASFAFMFFFEGAQKLSYPLAISSLVCFSFLILFVKQPERGQSNILFFIGSLLLSLIYATAFSGGLFSPMMWGLLIVSPLSYQFLTNKNIAHCISLTAITSIIVLFLGHQFRFLPTNYLSGPSNPTIQLLAIFPVMFYFPFHALIQAHFKKKDIEETENDQFTIAS